MNLDVIWKNAPYFAWGITVTVEVSLFAIVVGSVIAIITAVARLGGPAPIRLIFSAYVEFFRNTPLLVQILVLFLGPSEMGFRLDGVQSLAVCLAVNCGAYMSEIIRGGLQSVPKGQTEAAASLGLGRARTFLEIVLPQAIRTVYPAMSNQFISVVLSSSLGAIIGAPELTNQVLTVNAQTYRTVELLIFLAVAYGVLSYITVRITRLVGHRLERAY
jgi:polar amino acid transport system permease protein